MKKISKMKIIVIGLLLATTLITEGKVFIARKGSSDTTRYELKQDAMNVITQDSTGYVKYIPFENNLKKVSK